MASFGFNFEGNDERKDKFRLKKLRTLFTGGSASSDQNISRGHNRKQGVGKSCSYNVSPGLDEGSSRNKPILPFSSSIPDRESFSHAENYQSEYHNNKRYSMQAYSRHPALSFSKSLPGHAYSSHGNLSVGESKATQTGGKLQLSRTGQDTFARHGDKLRRKAQVWKNDLDLAKKRKEDIHFNIQRTFHFDDEISLTSHYSNPEDHIYEEIDSDIFTSCIEEENEVEENLLLGISLERRNNLKFYGSAGWDFGNGSWN